MMAAKRLVIAGCMGRMGQAIARVVLEEGAFTLAGAFEQAGNNAVGKDYGALLGLPQPLNVLVSAEPDVALRAGDVCIDFTVPVASVSNAQRAAQFGKALVIGTTGMDASQRSAVQEAAKRVPIVMSPNMSLGVNLLFELAAIAAGRLGKEFDIEVVEAHHHHKKDAPSGTAKRLVEVMEQARKLPAGSIPAHAVRAGDIVGDHTALFAGPTERLELTHRAHSREVFARGAVRAAAFALSQPPGLYDMGDVLKHLQVL
jgi:4-hydroxy-tetrahydrodipicolinate reductase